MDYLTDLTFPSQNSDRFFQKYLSIGLNIVPGCPLVGSCYPVEGIMAFHDDSAVQPGRCFLLVNMCIYTSPVVSVGQVRLVENFRCASGDSLAEQVADTFVLPEDGCNDRHIADLGRIRQFFDNTGCPQQYGAVFITPYELDALLPGRGPGWKYRPLLPVSAKTVFHKFHPFY